MKKILLVCNAGISTSILVSKMKKAAQAQGIDVSIQVKSMTGVKDVIQDMDIVLLAPQIGYEQKKLQDLAGDIPVEKVDVRDFGILNGEGVLREAMKVLENSES
ncbi:MAG: PTS sugar transporter subunit IIB [Lachnospiraceae bacterium]|jgi:PTS system cellobiose-specific IIB component|nr:PTS sugar transporter subunit IIB [Lachnospiraceae bacterium]MCI9592198.1 PTS sugar transporter subunit IIB [Lachnospiraceae bacterium]